MKKMKDLKRKKKMKEWKKKKKKRRENHHSFLHNHFHLHQEIFQLLEYLKRREEERGVLALEKEDFLEDRALFETRSPQESNPQALSLGELLTSLLAVTPSFQKQADPSFFS